MTWQPFSTKVRWAQYMQLMEVTFSLAHTAKTGDTYFQSLLLQDIQGDITTTAFVPWWNRRESPIAHGRHLRVLPPTSEIEKISKVMILSLKDHYLLLQLLGTLQQPNHLPFQYSRSVSFYINRSYINRRWTRAWYFIIKEAVYSSIGSIIYLRWDQLKMGLSWLYLFRPSLQPLPPPVASSAGCLQLPYSLKTLYLWHLSYLETDTKPCDANNREEVIKSNTYILSSGVKPIFLPIPLSYDVPYFRDPK